jgi:hypothetical protein
MRLGRITAVLALLAVSGLVGGEADAHKKKFPTAATIQAVVIGNPGSVNGELSGSAKCLGGRTVTVTKNGNPLGTVSTSAGGDFALSNVTIASGDQLVANVAKRTIKRSGGHRHICLGAASPVFIPRLLEVTVDHVLLADDGNVTGPGIACPPGCQRVYHQGTAITLTSNVVDDTFAGWSGACMSAGNNATCNLTINADTSVGATYFAI